jgi:hypothetical protein
LELLGNVTDGELVFEQLQAKLRRMSEQFS